MFDSITKRKVSQQEEIFQRGEISSTIVDNTEPQKTNYKKYLTDIVEYANEGIHSSINSLQSINIIQKMQKISHIYEMPSSIILSDINADLFAPTIQKFLGDYTLEDIDYSVNKYGIKKELEIKGYKDIIINFDTSDYFVHKLSITDKSLLNFKNINGQFLINLFVRKKEFIVSDFKTYQILRRVETFYAEKDFENNKLIEKINYIDGFGAMEVYKFMESQLNDKYLLYLIEWICMQGIYIILFITFKTDKIFKNNNILNL
jgi:hypothetical protein